MSEQRTFTVEGHGGVYKGKIPSSVAKKAARQLFKDSPGKKTLSFTLRETTQGSKKKTFLYSATKKILNPPLVIKKGNVSITIKTEIKVKKA